MRIPRMTTRRWMIVMAAVALGCWLGLAAYRVHADVRSSWVYHVWEWDGPTEYESVFETSHPAPFWPRLRARLLGRAPSAAELCGDLDDPHALRAEVVDTMYSGPNRAFFSATYRARKHGASIKPRDVGDWGGEKRDSSPSGNAASTKPDR